MKTPKLLKKGRELLKTGSMKRRKQIRSLKELLEKLKKKSKHLRGKLKQENTDKARSKIEKDLNMLDAQRKKGLKALKELKKK